MQEQQQQQDSRVEAGATGVVEVEGQATLAYSSAERVLALVEAVGLCPVSCGRIIRQAVGW